MFYKFYAGFMNTTWHNMIPRLHDNNVNKTVIKPIKQMKSENIFDIELRISSDWPEEQGNSCLISIFKREELEKSIVIMATCRQIKDLLRKNVSFIRW